MADNSTRYPHAIVIGHLCDADPRDASFRDVSVDEAKATFTSLIRTEVRNEGGPDNVEVYIDYVVTSDSPIELHA